MKKWRRLIGATALALVGVFATFAGQPSAQEGLSAGHILVTDVELQTVIRIDPATGAQELVVPAGSLSVPVGVAIDVNGDILVANLTSQSKVVRIDPATGGITVETELSSKIPGSPRSLDVDRSGLIYVSHTSAGIHGVTRFNPATGDAASFVGGIFEAVAGVDAASDGLVFLAGRDSVSADAAVFRVNFTSGIRTVLSSGDNLFGTADDVAVEDDDHVLVVDDSTALDPTLGGVFRVHRGTGNQTVVSQGGSFMQPTGIDTGCDGEIFVLDGDARAVFRVDPRTGAQTTVSSGNLINFPSSIAVVPGPARRLPYSTLTSPHSWPPGSPDWPTLSGRLSSRTLLSISIWTRTMTASETATTSAAAHQPVRRA